MNSQEDDSKLVCHCGKDAIGLISNVGWLCKDCFDTNKNELPQIKSE